ncbi:DUF547 domain-containing protein [Gilvimarinus agarilyticus]|uniref:DUF547 domain-containing protein n=1 Tax=Gilvimarinus sp. 2_MG-2023 TaxID=3062666 RepID=UPI001C085289|nr:DUF547 domain-containing protein [Gilvimarinus sp. 2_MG-2023]MBU2884788.1 DUF547 domain-containing protein [Gilvimarinus agarilyticus]MDO6569838.1 DUF547 domain-containing protein [Gilvimarinus sp. 2_MG-2023]
MKTVLLFLVFLFGSHVVIAADFDHQHSVYADVLKENVGWTRDGVASEVNYALLKSNPKTLEQYAEQLSGVKRDTFDGWTKNQQLAFLINAYNAYTLQLIVEHYPLASIKDIGSFWQSPWQQSFFTLLGKDMSLDELEHEIIRAPNRYNEPRIHFAVNCASIGCPALRPEPFTADQLEQHLEDSTKRFLRDTTRNRYRDGEFQVSAIFKWYRQDFEQGWLGFNNLRDFFLRYADAMSLTQPQREQLSNAQAKYTFLPYDWSLNSSAEK